MRIQSMIAALTVAAVTATAQDTAYRITGTVPDSVKTVYLGVMGEREFADSTTVTGGKFTFTGEKPLNTVLIVADSQNGVSLFNDGTPVALDFVNGNIESSELNRKLYACGRLLAKYNEPTIDLFAEMLEARADSTPAGRKRKAELSRRFSQLADSAMAEQLAIIRDNRNNLIPAVFLPPISYRMEYAALKALLDENAPYYSHPLMKPVREQTERYEREMAARMPGKMFTDLEMSDTGGRKRRLSEWCGQGNYVLIDFWASWCGPCRMEMPNVVANYEKYHPKGFEIVGISFDNKAEAWKKAISTLGMKWPQLSDLKGWQSEGAQVYSISSIPASILLDRDGKIIATDLRGVLLGAKLKELYGF